MFAVHLAKRPSTLTPICFDVKRISLLSTSTPCAVTVLAATSAALLVVVLVRLRPRYRETLAATLRDHQLDATDLERVLQSPTAERLIEGLLRANDAEVSRATIELLAGRKLGALAPTLLELVGKERDEVAVAPPSEASRYYRNVTFLTFIGPFRFSNLEEGPLPGDEHD